MPEGSPSTGDLQPCAGGSVHLHCLFLWAQLSTGFWEFKARLQEERLIEVVYVTPELEETAYDILRAYDGQAFSYVDATSFAIMRQQRNTFVQFIVSQVSVMTLCASKRMKS